VVDSEGNTLDFLLVPNLSLWAAEPVKPFNALLTLELQQWTWIRPCITTLLTSKTIEQLLPTKRPNFGRWRYLDSSSGAKITETSTRLTKKLGMGFCSLVILTSIGFLSESISPRSIEVTAKEGWQGLTQNSLPAQYLYEEGNSGLTSMRKWKQAYRYVQSARLLSYVLTLMVKWHAGRRRQMKTRWQPIQEPKVCMRGVAATSNSDEGLTTHSPVSGTARQVLPRWNNPSVPTMATAPQPHG